MKLTAGVCLCAFVSPSFRPLYLSVFSPSLSPSSSVSSSSQRGLNQAETNPTLPFVLLSRSPRSGERELPYSGATSEDQFEQMTPSRARAGSLIAGVSLRPILPLGSAPINYDRWRATRAVDYATPGRVARDCPASCLFPSPRLSSGRRGTTLSAGEKDVGEVPRGRPRGAARAARRSRRVACARARAFPRTGANSRTRRNANLSLRKRIAYFHIHTFTRRQVIYLYGNEKKNTI